MDYDSTVNIVKNDQKSKETPNTQREIMDKSQEDFDQYDIPYSESKKIKTRNIEKEKSIMVMNSEKASVKIREHDYLDRLTFYNNFKLSNSAYIDPKFKPNFFSVVPQTYEDEVKLESGDIKFDRVKSIFQNERIYKKENPNFFKFILVISSSKP